MAVQPPSPPTEPQAPRERPEYGEVSGYRVSADSDAVEGFRQDDGYESARSAKGGKGKAGSRQTVSSGESQDPEGWVNT